jgi:glycosyltransferase involved in cell wall biosynthesis
MSWGFDLLQDADRNRWWRWATRFVLHRATCFTCDCEAARQKAIQFGVSRDRTVVFPWGVDLKQFIPLRNNPGSRLFTLFCNRSWEPRYGVDVLAKAFTLVAASRSDVNLLLLAGGSQGEAIRQILHPGRIDDRITYAGQVPQRELPAYYQMADLYISPAHVDGSSVSLMEALACGLPCLVSNIPANQEWVTEGVNGWLFEDGDADALAARILLIMDTRESLDKVGEAARRVAEVKGDWSKNFRKLLETYELVLR